MGKRQGPTRKRPWQPMSPALPAPGQAETFRRLEPHGRLFQNDLYTAIVVPDDPADRLVLRGRVHISVRRRDRKVIRDWRHLQRIKNDIVGDEREAFELFPAESRLTDSANQYHLWVLPEGERMPVGFQQRVVSTDDGGLEVNGVVLDGEDLTAALAEIGATPEDMNRGRQRPRSELT